MSLWGLLCVSLWLPCVLRDVELSVGSETSLFCSDVVAFNAIFPSTRRESESAWRRAARLHAATEKKKRRTDRRCIRARAGCFTQHFVEHCAILVCSSHSVNVGGVAPRKQILTLEDDSSPERCFSFPVRWLGHSTRRFSLQVGAWHLCLGFPLLFSSCTQFQHQKFQGVLVQYQTRVYI